MIKDFLFGMFGIASVLGGVLFILGALYLHSRLVEAGNSFGGGAASFKNAYVQTMNTYPTAFKFSRDAFVLCVFGVVGTILLNFIF
jgi:hypothetical protein